MPLPKSRNFKVDGWDSGVNNVYREDLVPPNQLREAVNVDLLEGGKVRRRSGYEEVLSESGFHSLVGFADQLFAVKGDTFYQIDVNTGIKQAVGEVAATDVVNYVGLNDFLILSDGQQLKKYSDGTFEALAPETPAGQPSIAADSLGALPEGDYQAAITFLRGEEESGSTLAVTAHLDEQGGLSLSNIPQPISPETTAIRVYASHAGGSDLFFVRDLPVGTTSTMVTQVPEGKTLDTQFLCELPAGQDVAVMNAQVCSAVGKVLYYSPPYRFGLTNLSDHYIPFPSTITMAQAVSSGIFVGLEDKVVFLEGQSLDDVTITTVDYDGVVPGTPTHVPASALPFLDMPDSEGVLVWWSTRGVLIVGLPNGTIGAVRDTELSLPEFGRGAIIPRAEDGVHQLVSVLSDIKRGSNLAVSDTVDAIVHRNGIQT